MRSMAMKLIHGVRQVLWRLLRPFVERQDQLIGELRSDLDQLLDRHAKIEREADICDSEEILRRLVLLEDEIARLTAQKKADSAAA